MKRFVFNFTGLNWTQERAKTVHKLVREAIEIGRLVASDHCQQCGRKVGEQRQRKDGTLSKPRAAVQPHHEDYSQPYRVIWLCGSCHMKRHRTAENFLWSAEALTVLRDS